jgi:hypothetical protein
MPILPQTTNGRFEAIIHRQVADPLLPLANDRYRASNVGRCDPAVSISSIRLPNGSSI